MEEYIQILKYLFLGLFQGLTEPIPVSSSGHLVIAQHFLDLKIEGLSFEVIVNFGSLLAVLLIYKNDLIRLIKNSIAHFKQPTEETKADLSFIVYLIIGTIPAGLIGFFFQDFLSTYFKGLPVIGVTLLVTGVALWLIKDFKGKRLDNDLKAKDAWIVGLAQAVALIPGMSRSGATIVASMFLGMNQQTALRFSFFLYIPISIGGMVLGMSDFLNDPNLSSLFIPYTVALIGALVMSYFSLKWFMGIMAKGKLIYFSIYCFIIGTFVLVISFF